MRGRRPLLARKTVRGGGGSDTDEEHFSPPGTDPRRGFVDEPHPESRTRVCEPVSGKLCRVVVEDHRQFVLRLAKTYNLITSLSCNSQVFGVLAQHATTEKKWKNNKVNSLRSWRAGLRMDSATVIYRTL